MRGGPFVWLGGVLEILTRFAPTRFWALMAGAPVVTAITVWLIWIVVFAPWPAALAPQQLMYAGLALLAFIILIGIIVTALAAAKVKVTTIGGGMIEIEGGEGMPIARAATGAVNTAAGKADAEEKAG